MNSFLFPILSSSCSSSSFTVLCAKNGEKKINSQFGAVSSTEFTETIESKRIAAGSHMATIIMKNNNNNDDDEKKKSL